MRNQIITEILQTDSEWSLEHAAWILTGYTKHIDGDPLVMRRLADGAALYFGTIEYREAKKERDRILELFHRHSGLFWSMQASFIDEKNPDKNKYPVAVIIDWVTARFPKYERIDIPWLESSTEQLINAEITKRAEQQFFMRTIRPKNEFYKWIYPIIC